MPPSAADAPRLCRQNSLFRCLRLATTYYLSLLAKTVVLQALVSYAMDNIHANHVAIRVVWGGGQATPAVLRTFLLWQKPVHLSLLQPASRFTADSITHCSLAKQQRQDRPQLALVA